MPLGKPTLHLVYHTAHYLGYITFVQSRTRVTYLVNKLLGAKVAVCPDLIECLSLSCAVHVRHLSLDVFCHVVWFLNLIPSV